MGSYSRSVSLVSIALLAVSVSACATFETGETKLQRVKTIGIISRPAGS
jgi:hypothetical protein